MPEFWGRPSKYTAGTNFLGTPKNHMDVSPQLTGSRLPARCMEGFAQDLCCMCPRSSSQSDPCRLT